MKAGILHYDVKREKLDEFKKVFDEFVTELRKELPFEGVFLFTDADTGKSFSVGFYSTMEIAKAVPSTNANRVFRSRIEPLLERSPEREIYDATGDLHRLGPMKKAA